MPTQEMSELTRQLRKIKRSIDDWRRTDATPRRIPEEIWEQAVAAAGKYGVGPVAKNLGLDHAKLKSKVPAENRQVLTVVPSQEPVPAAFLEFLSPPAPARCLERCVLEVESSRGARVRVEVCGLELPGLVTLLREFVS